MFKKVLSLAVSSVVALSSVLVIAAQPAFAAGLNVVPNSSFETVNATNSALPQSWLQGGWGTNTRSFTYATTGNTGTKSAKVTISSYTSGDAKWYFAPVAITPNTTYQLSDYYQSTVASRVVLQFDNGAGVYTYQELPGAAVSSSWAHYQTTFTTPASAQNVSVFHLISAVGSLTIDDMDVSLPGVVAPTPPQVAITAPVNGSTAIGTVNVTASATAQSGASITQVQYKIDGAVAATITTSPYTYVLNTQLLTNAAHTLTAVATDSNGLSTTSGAVSFTVTNPIVVPPTTTNLIPNPSVETAAGNSPQDWYSGAWGSNTTSFSYSTTAHTGTRSVRVDMSNFSNGGANWTYAQVPVVAGKTYSFTSYYQSSTATQVLVAVKMSNGSTQYLWLGNPIVSNGAWTKFYATVTMPAGAVSAIAYHSISANGYLMVDDSNLQAYSPSSFSSPLITVTFDDNIETQYTNALPILNANNIKATFYTISGYMGICNPNISSICYMSPAHVQALAAAGHEIGSHTIDHPALTSLTPTQLDTQLSQSKSVLTQLTGTPITSLAAPYGAVNSTVLAASQQYYASQRGTMPGYNDKSNWNTQNLLAQSVDSSTSVAQVKAFIDNAIATNTWLILVYHDINVDGSFDPGYNTTPADFSAEMAYITSKGVQTATLSQAIAILTPQLTQ